MDRSIPGSVVIRFAWLGILALIPGCAPNAAAPMTEVSGVTRSGAYLYMVSDEDPNAYYRVFLKRRTGQLIPIRQDELERVPVDSPPANDLESLDRLSDGRLVLLSEENRRLVTAGGIVAAYDSTTLMVAGRGLEGLAVRALDDGSSRVAVIWEGGYPSRSQIPHGETARARLPFVLIHDLAAGASVTVDAQSRQVQRIPIHVPVPAGDEPGAQRFRSPDLVWHRARGEAEWGFILMLSSENAEGPVDYRYHWLHRFDARGFPVGEPIDLDQIAPPRIRKRNFEGLAWFDENHLVITYENHADEAVFYALVIELPGDWR